MAQNQGGRRYFDLSTPSGFFLTLAVILLAGVIIRLFHFHLTIGSDDQRWIMTARQLGGTHDPGMHPVYYGRVLWRLFLFVWGIPWGLTLQTTAPLMFLLSCYSTWITGLAGRFAFGPRAGILAAGIYAAHPIMVVYDVQTLPDNLALAFLTTEIYLFLRYLKSGRVTHLMMAGLLIGLSFSVKSYYVLVAVPLGICLLFGQEKFSGRLRNTVAFSAGFAAGLLPNLLLNAWDVGSALASFNLGASDYGTRISAGSAMDHVGFQRWARLLSDRMQYLDWLFFGLGVSGMVIAWAAGFLAAGLSRMRRDVWMLAGASSLLILFLMFTPANLQPFKFVEMQIRYLTILMPFLAVAGGGALAAAFDAMQGKWARYSLPVTLLILVLNGALVPNDPTRSALPRDRTLQFIGIENVLKNASKQGIRELVFPASFYYLMPDSYYQIGPKLHFSDVVDAEAAGKMVEYLHGEGGRAFFVPRRDVRWTLEPLLVRGDLAPESEREKGYSILMDLLETGGGKSQAVRVPETAILYWLWKWGIGPGEQHLVGWVCGLRQARPASE